MSEEKERQPEVLIIGAGNIGRVYGYHLFKAGCKVHYYVREHNRQNLTNYPLRIHQLSSIIRFLNKSTTVKFSDYTITTDVDIANGNAPNLPEQLDYVIFTVPSFRINEGDWFKILINFLNTKYQKNVYYTSPVPDDTGMQRFIDLGIDKTQIISGQTNTSSYFAPLENQKFEPRGEETAKKDAEDDNPNKVIVYCCMLNETYGQLTDEAKEATDKLVNLLKKGGLNAVNINKDTQYELMALLSVPFLAISSVYDWNFYNLGRDVSVVSLLLSAISDVAQIIIKKTDNKVSPVIKVFSYIPAFSFALILIFMHYFSVYICSFDFEVFCKTHFTVKLGDQTDFFTSIIKNDAEKYGVDITHFNKIIDIYHSSMKKSE